MAGRGQEKGRLNAGRKLGLLEKGPHPSGPVTVDGEIGQVKALWI